MYFNTCVKMSLLNKSMIYTSSLISRNDIRTKVLQTHRKVIPDNLVVFRIITCWILLAKFYSFFFKLFTRLNRKIRLFRILNLLSIHFKSGYTRGSSICITVWDQKNIMQIEIMQIELFTFCIQNFRQKKKIL